MLGAHAAAIAMVLRAAIEPSAPRKAFEADGTTRCLLRGGVLYRLLLYASPNLQVTRGILGELK